MEETATEPRCPVLERVLTAVELHADRPAVVGADRTLSYAQVGATIERVAGVLRDSAPPGSVVAVSTRGGVDLPGVFLGVRAAGLVPYLLDAYLPRARVEALLAVARPAVVIEEAPPHRLRPGVPDPRVLPPAAGYVVFTSGSQGAPKGIVGNAAGLDRFLDWEVRELALEPGRPAAVLTSPSFDVVLREMLVPLVCGGRLHVAGPRVRTDPRSVLPWLREEGVELLHLVPSLSARWLAGHDLGLPRLRWSVFAGEPLYARHVRQWRQAAPNSRIGNLYGPSETTLAKFWHRVDGPVEGLLPVGRPLPGTVLHRLPVPEHAAAAPGTFRIGIETPDGSLGYLDPDRIGEVAGTLRRAREVTLFETQDRGRTAPDGSLIVAGRLDSIVKRRGAAVDTASIAAAALDDPGVEAACCFQVDRDAEGDLVLALAVRGEPAVDRGALVTALRTALGPAMPDAVLACEQLPRLPSGKVDAGAVARGLASGELAARPLFGAARFGSTSVNDNPTNEREAQPR
ncbi:hypothetical protein GCM10009738_09250 [Kitasatospora viridis]